MISLDDELNQRLETLREQGLRRELRRVDSAQGPRIKIGGRTFLNFSSNDYLGLANHPALKEADIKAVEQFGVGAGASRLICGSLAPLHELEEALAAFKSTEAALTFSTGYAAAIGTICALLGKDDIIILDKLVHASIVDAARLSGAKLRVFDHNDLNDLEKILKWANKRAASQFGVRGQVRALERRDMSRRGKAATRRRTPNQDTNNKRKAEILIVTESIFSMDGDAAPLREIVKLKNKHGAWLMVDEAHATGLYGKNRRGLAEELGVSGQIEIQMGTLGKALGASGGYICGSRALVDFLVNRARSFIFSTAPVPAAAAAATAGVRLVRSNEGKKLNEQLWRRVGEFNFALRTPHSALPSAIIPLIIGDESRAVELADELRK